MELAGFDLENDFKMIGITIGKKTPTNQIGRASCRERV